MPLWMRPGACVLSFLAILSVVASMQSAPSAADILQGLDLTSFRNSTGPSRAEGLRRPADWSFSRLTVEEERASLERPGNSWVISLRIIRRTPDGVIACFSDRAQNGGTYDAQKALRIVPDSLGGYTVLDQNIVETSCSPRPGQG